MSNSMTYLDPEGIKVFKEHMDETYKSEIAQINSELNSKIIQNGVFTSYTFNTTDTIQNQIDSISNDGVFILGYIESYGMGGNLGLPTNGASYFLLIYRHSSAYVTVIAINIGMASKIYICGKDSGTWSDSWKSLDLT